MGYHRIGVSVLGVTPVNDSRLFRPDYIQPFELFGDLIAAIRDFDATLSPENLFDCFTRSSTGRTIPPQ
ncbi:MAG: hypothetical protein IH853_10740 [Bacteroidetes bacterium]|nr:hypothetical protein [Bacteroidota bacterium]